MATLAWRPVTYHGNSCFLFYPETRRMTLSEAARRAEEFSLCVDEVWLHDCWGRGRSGWSRMDDETYGRWVQ